MSQKKKINSLVGKLKKNAVQLLVQKQLPKGLVKLIYDLNDECTLKEVLYLKECCEHYMRIKDYYKRYDYLDKQYSDLIIKEFYTRFKKS